jgi:hypothetical protein
MGAAQPQGIAGASTLQAQRMASGGPVRLAQGGSLGDYAKTSGISSQDQNVSYQPVSYNPTFTPSDTSIAAAANQINPLYGNGPDFQDTINKTKALTPPKPNQGLGNWLTNLVGGAMSAPGNATQAWGAGLMGANKLANEGQQQGFQNELVQQGQVLSGQKDQAQRQQSIAEATQRYQASQAALADSQQKEAAEVARGNSQGALAAQTEQARIKQEQAQATRELAQSMGNPLFVASALGRAKASGDKPGMQMYGDALKALQGQQQSVSDIEQRRQSALASQTFHQQSALESQKLSGELRNELAKMGMTPEMLQTSQPGNDWKKQTTASGSTIAVSPDGKQANVNGLTLPMGPDGKPVLPPGPLSATAKAIAEYRNVGLRLD